MKIVNVQVLVRVAALLALAAISMLAVGRITAPQAHAAAGTPDEAISIDVNGGGDDCDTRPSTGGIGTMCSVTVGGMFTVKGHVDSFTGISGSGGYGGINFRLANSAGLTLNQRSAVTELGPAGTPYWPLCSSRSESTPAGAYEAVCHSSGPSSTFIGKVLEVDYTCMSAGMQPVTMVDANTFLYDSTHSPDNSDKEGDEVLTINCLAAVGGIAHLPDVSDPTSLSVEDSSSSWSAWLVALAAAGAVVTVVAGAAWRLRSRRVR
jgi:hypothetical protein